MDTMVPGISIVDVDVMLSSQYRVSEKKKWKHKKKACSGGGARGGHFQDLEI